MPKYFIQQRINTIAQIWEPFEFKGFQFKPHQINWIEGSQRGWIASKTLTAADCATAFRDFYSELYPLVDRIAFVTQCYAVVGLEPYLLKRTDRLEFFLRFSRIRNPVPLPFGPDQLESLRALEKYNEKGEAFRYLREAINSPDFYARLAMLASALEGIAGEKSKGVTNHAYIKQTILHDAALHEGLFKSGDGIRNQLLHGKKIDEKKHGTTRYPSVIYDRIVEYFNKYHGTKINTNVINAPRSIALDYDTWPGWLNPISQVRDIDLEYFCERDLHEATKDFETIEKPSDY